MVDAQGLQPPESQGWRSVPPLRPIRYNRDKARLQWPLAQVRYRHTRQRRITPTPHLVARQGSYSA